MTLEQVSPAAADQQPKLSVQFRTPGSDQVSWFRPGSAQQCSWMKHGEITSSRSSKDRAVLPRDHAPGCAAEPLSGLRTQRASHCSSTVTITASPRTSRTQQLQAPTSAKNHWQPRQTRESRIKSCQQPVSQDHLAVPLHWFCLLKSPESGSDVLFF